MSSLPFISLKGLGKAGRPSLVLEMKRMHTADRRRADSGRRDLSFTTCYERWVHQPPGLDNSPKLSRSTSGDVCSSAVSSQKHPLWQCCLTAGRSLDFDECG